MTTLAVLLAVISIFTVVLYQEWREAVQSRRYVERMGKAKPNVRRVGV